MWLHKLPLEIIDAYSYADNKLANELGKEILYKQMNNAQVIREKYELVQNGLNALQSGVDFDFTADASLTSYSMKNAWLSCYTVAQILQVAERTVYEGSVEHSFTWHDAEMSTGEVMHELLLGFHGGEYSLPDGVNLFHLADYGVDITYNRSCKYDGVHTITVIKRNVEESLINAFDNCDHYMLNYLMYEYSVDWSILNKKRWCAPVIDLNNLTVTWYDMCVINCKPDLYDKRLFRFIKDLHYHTIPISYWSYSEKDLNGMVSGDVTVKQQAYFAAMLREACLEYIRKKVGGYVALSDIEHTLGKGVTELFLAVYIITYGALYSKKDCVKELMKYGRKIRKLV